MKCKSNKYYQWDINQHLSDINDKYVDFVINGEVYRLEVENNAVRIPDEVFQTSGQKIAYICYSDGTREAFTFTVTARPIPPSYAYTETEKATFDSLTESVRTALEDLQMRVERGDFNGKDGKDGKDGAEYDDTEIKGEIASIKQKLSDKVEFYPVYLEQAPDRFIHYEEDGTATELHFADLADKYNDEKYFLYLEYASITFIPSLPPVEDPIHDAIVLEFSVVWHYGGEQRITSVKINSDEQLKIDEFVCASKDEIPSLDGYPKDVKINGSSIVENGVAEIPIASEYSNGNKLGLSRYYKNFGITVNASGQPSIVRATQSDIDARTSQFYPITPYTLEYAVKSVTDKPWQLKGTLTTANKDNGVNVDLSGCTEIFIKGYAQASTVQSLYVNSMSYVFWDSAINTSKRYYRFLSKVNSIDGYGMTEYAKFSTSQNYVNSNMSVNDRTNLRLEDINKFMFSDTNTITDCNLEIYAR